MTRRDFWIKIVPQAIIAAVLAGWFITLAASSGTTTLTGRLGGDFPAFYGAGSIVVEGDIGDLYDFNRQREEQSEIFESGFLAFAYPSYVAAAYSPLARLPFRTAYVVHTLAAAVALALSVLIATRFSPTARRYPWLVGAAALLFYPLLRAVLGGQNTAFGLLVIVGAWALLGRDRDLAAGLVLSLLAYKPQFLIPIVGVLFLAGRWRTVVGAALGVIGHYLGGVALSGWSWPVEWWTEAVRFANIDQAVNGPRSISWRGWSHLFTGEGPMGNAAEWLWVVPAGITVLWVAIVTVRRGRQDPLGVLALALPTMLLIAPHAMFYDAGLALPTLLLVADRGQTRIASLLWVAGWLQALSFFGTGLSPLVGVSLLTALAARRSLLQ